MSVMLVFVWTCVALCVVVATAVFLIIRDAERNEEADRRRAEARKASVLRSVRQDA